MRLLYIANVDWYFVLHWLDRCVAAKKAGYEVAVACAITNRKHVERLRDAGIEVYELSLHRRGTNLIGEWRAFLTVRRAIKRFRPDLLHAATIKPVVYGGLYARLRGIPSVFSLPGLGTLFLSSFFHHRLLRRVVGLCYAFAFRRQDCEVLVENAEDRQLLIEAGVVDQANISCVPGAGIEIGDASPRMMEPHEPTRVLFAARLYRGKGLEDLVAAVELLRNQGCRVELWVAGIFDEHAVGAFTRAEVDQLLRKPGIRWLGSLDGLDEVLQQVDIVCQPSRTREGLPRTLLEGAAAGLPLVGTDVPGCRSIVLPGITGLLAPPNDAQGLADRIRTLAEDPALRRTLGASARRYVRQHHSTSHIVQMTLARYRALVEGPIVDALPESA